MLYLEATTLMCGYIIMSMYMHVSEYTLDLSRKLSKKWGVGRHSVVGPLSQGYDIIWFCSHPI